jgi:hypothetical protein
MLAGFSNGIGSHSRYHGVCCCVIGRCWLYKITASRPGTFVRNYCNRNGLRKRMAAASYLIVRYSNAIEIRPVRKNHVLF